MAKQEQKRAAPIMPTTIPEVQTILTPTVIAHPTAEDDPILTPEEVGRRLGKSGTTIRRWINDGLLDYVQNPKGLPGVRQSDVNRYLAACSGPMKGKTV